MSEFGARHGWDHDRVFTMTAEQFRADLKRAKAAIACRLVRPLDPADDDRLTVLRLHSALEIGDDAAGVEGQIVQWSPQNSAFGVVSRADRSVTPYFAVQSAPDEHTWTLP